MCIIRSLIMYEFETHTFVLIVYVLFKFNILRGCMFSNGRYLLKMNTNCIQPNKMEATSLILFN